MPGCMDFTPPRASVWIWDLLRLLLVSMKTSRSNRSAANVANSSSMYFMSMMLSTKRNLVVL